jgi:hypothetical protein
MNLVMSWFPIKTKSLNLAAPIKQCGIVCLKGCLKIAHIQLNGKKPQSFCEEHNIRLAWFIHIVAYASKFTDPPALCICSIVVESKEDAIGQ